MAQGPEDQCPGNLARSAFRVCQEESTALGWEAVRGKGSLVGSLWPGGWPCLSRCTAAPGLEERRAPQQTFQGAQQDFQCFS